MRERLRRWVVVWAPGIGALVFVICGLGIPLAGLPDWRSSPTHYAAEAAHPHSLSPQFYEEMEQMYSITAVDSYTIRLKLVDGADARRCARDTVDTRVRFQKCTYTTYDSGSTCACEASYGFLVDKSIQRGDDKAAAVWRRNYIARIAVFAATISWPLLIGLSFAVPFFGLQGEPTAGCRTILYRITAVLLTASYGFPFVAFFVWTHLTNVNWCFNAVTGDMHAAPCEVGVGPYLMLAASSVNFVPLVLLLLFDVVVKCVERRRVKRQRQAAGAAAPVSLPAPVVSHGPPAAAVVGNVSNPQDGGDLANV